MIHSPSTNMKSRIKFYFDYSTVHGVRYIGGTIASKISSVVWAVCFVSSICGFAYYLTEIYQKGYIKPEIGLRINSKPVNEYPFPAMTLCPSIGVKREFLDYKNHLKNFTKLSADKLRLFAAMTEVCDPPETVEMLEIYKNLPEINAAEVFNKFSPSIEESFALCAPRPSQTIQNCTKHFARVLVDDAICYTFNILHYTDIFNEGIHSDFDAFKANGKSKRSGEWGLQDGYNVKTSDAYPMPAGQEAFKLVLKINATEEQNFCHRFGRDYKLYFHLPNEVPTPLHDYNYVNLRTENKIVRNFN